MSQKIEGVDTNDLLKHKNLLYILYRWKEWDKEKNWEKFVTEITEDNRKLLLFMAKFISESRSQTIGDYGVKVTKKFNYTSLGDFFNLDQAKTRLEEIKKTLL